MLKIKIKYKLTKVGFFEKNSQNCAIFKCHKTIDNVINWTHKTDYTTSI